MKAHQILFYYNSRGVNGIVLQCATVLRDAGNQVTVIDVKGKQRDPGGDNWGAYDQVWDLRYVDEDKEKCASGSPSSPDYFDIRWQDKAVQYLNHCGKLFVGAEYFILTDRNEGLYHFLKEIHAVKNEYDTCPPSPRGNSSTDSSEFYPVKNGLGPATFYGKLVGGIPLAVLTGTSFVDTWEDWVGDDKVDRSIVSAWKGKQLGGLVRAPLACRGKLFMVWDATMWTLWDPDVQDQARSQHPWDESSWFPPNPEANEDRQWAEEIRRGQAVTRKFFPAVARWLGNEACPCGPETTMGYGVDQAVTPTAKPRVPSSPRAPLPITTPTPFVPKSQISFSSSKTSGLSAPETLQFGAVPINLYIRFRDGLGEYQLDLWDSQGRHISLLYDAKISTQKDDWASWDGLDEKGARMSPGVYSAVLSKDGKFLRKVILVWAILPQNSK